MFCLPRAPVLGLTLVLSTFAQSAPAAADSTLSRLLSPQEFQEAGLTKLTPEELARLATALQRHGMLSASDVAAAAPALPAAAAAQTPATARSEKAADSFGAEQIARQKSAETPNELHSRIEGTLQEFSGRAAFVLENGQVWQLRIPEAVYFSHKLVNPAVVISRSLGGYKMLIVPANRVIFVKRIQ